MPCDAPQAEQRTVAKREWHDGQLACVSNTSNGVRHEGHTHSGPIGGAVRHDGQAMPVCRGSRSTRHSSRACWKPRQQFMPMNAARMPSHADSARRARNARAATPTKPNAEAASRLRERPITNHSSERRICPPSSG